MYPSAPRPDGTMSAVLLAAVVSLVAIPGTQPVRAQPAPPMSSDNEWTVVGQVLDAAGAGVEGASVQVETGGDGKTEGRVLGRAASDRAGDFRIRLPGEPPGKLFVRVKKEGFAVFLAPVEFEPGERETFVDVEMTGAMSVRGTVVAAETGRPVDGADVLIDMLGRRWEAKTDDRGRFELRGLPAGAGLLVVSRPGFGRQRQRIRVGADAAEVRVRLAPERPVRVRLVNDRGEPVAEAEIEVEAGEDTFSATTDADGRADLHGIGQDTTEIAWRAAHPDGMRMADVANRLAFDEATATPETMPSASRPAVYTLVLPRGGKVAGRITDAANGKPVNGARVLIAAGPGGTLIDWTGAEGNFEIAGVAPGRIVLAVQHPDYAPELIEDEARPGWTRRIPIRLSEGKPLAGTVVDEAGKPLDQVQVVCTRWRDHDVVGLRALTDAQGRFAFEHAPDGPIEFAFFRPGGGRPQGRTLTAGRTDYRVTLPAPEKAAEAGEEAAPRGGALRAGKAAPEFRVTATDGTRYQLSKLRGKYVFLDIWATWCPPCRTEMPTLKQLYAEMKSRSDFLMLGISLDATAEAVEAFAEKEKLTWPLVAGPDSGAETTAGIFGVKFIPFNVLIGPDGKVLAVEIHGADMPERIRDLARPATKEPSGQ